jgi:predicted helicase
MDNLKTREVRKGTIYIRDNEWFTMRNVFKMGVSSDAKSRSSTYITSEPIGGEYVLIILIPLELMKIVDDDLKHHFKHYNIYHKNKKTPSGTEFYDRCIIYLIEPYLKQLNIPYKVLTKEEIELIERYEQITYDDDLFIDDEDIISIDKYEKLMNVDKFEDTTCKTIKPKKHQQDVLNLINGFYNSNNIGKIIWPCGLGKALLSILIAKELNFKKVLFGVPNKNLQEQMKNEIVKIFPNEDNILFVGGNDCLTINATTDKNLIITFLNDNINSQPKFIVSTYHSCHLLVDLNINFNFKIGDESHHLVGIEKEQTQGFKLFHKINSLKTLFMTATEKNIGMTSIEKYSMNDESVFGKCIDEKTVHWAIENKQITDYNIITLKNKEDDVDEIIKSLRLNIDNKEIFISCYMCLKSFEIYNNLTHILLYTNTQIDAELAEQYISQILKLNILPISEKMIYNRGLHSNNCNNLSNEICKFENAHYGIISCVHLFGEGTSITKLNSVCIASNMQSEIRIVQYLLRPNRLNPENPDKIAYIIIPYIDYDNWETENNSYDKVRHIASIMRNVDENVEQKIFVFVGKKEDDEIESNEDENYDQNKKEEKINLNNHTNYKFEENIDELNKLKLRLRYSKALRSNFSEEQNEYNYVKSINSNLNINSPEDYVNKQNVHAHFIDSPEEYFKLKGVWVNWYDFIGMDTSLFIQCKKHWINFCKEKQINSLEEYNLNCDLYKCLPRSPENFYKDFTNILYELKLNNNRRK